MQIVWRQMFSKEDSGSIRRRFNFTYVSMPMKLIEGKLIPIYNKKLFDCWRFTRWFFFQFSYFRKEENLCRFVKKLKMNDGLPFIKVTKNSGPNFTTALINQLISRASDNTFPIFISLVVISLLPSAPVAPLAWYFNKVFKSCNLK